uniref:RNA-directed DNA polymerase, eukaryota, reverse transcriptase zinc-binding domain protein n=1 Tax=Tanacetum cinerariifolium TaxID=118510 RepID=A0A6L2JLE5_TANCI|nr:RNA-directed DNA polymerase, eukaryota, reverse transcriptase zinc-binding domain protein [Tanacetum cinerariifolium]
MGSLRSKDDEVMKLSSSIFVTNFSNKFYAKELWTVCRQYGTVVDAFIPNRRSELGKRFGFVCFIKIFDVNRLVNNLYTIWVGRFKLHANIARFQRPPLNTNNSACYKGDQNASKESSNERGETGKNNSYAHVVNNGPYQKKEEAPTIVLDETCVNSTDYSLALMGKVKDFTSLTNLKLVLANEGFVNVKLKYMGGFLVMIGFNSEADKERFRSKVGIGSWFAQLSQASYSFCIDERVSWIDIEGIPIKAWSKNTFSRITSKHEMSNEGIIDENEELKNGPNVERESDLEEVAKTIFEQHQSHVNRNEGNSDAQEEIRSEEPFNIYDLLRKTKDTNINSTNSEDTLKYPPGFTPETDVDAQINSPKELEVEGPSVGNSGGILCVWDPRLFRKSNSTMSDYLVIIQGEWIPNGKKLTIFSIYAPQELREKKMLWDYLILVLNNWKGEVVIMGDFNEVRTQNERYGSIFNTQGVDAFNLFISSAGLEETIGLLMRESHHDYGPIPFCFFHYWYLKEKIRTCIKTNKDRSKKYKQGLKEELAQVDLLIDNGEGNSDIHSKRMKIFKSLQEFDKLQSMELAQKAKIKWAIEGDENSKYYHRVLNKNRNQLNIQGILVEGRWIESPLLNESNIHTILRILDCFYHASGLRINMLKSKLMGILIPSDKVSQAAKKIGCVILQAPFSYLGSKVGVLMSRIQSWNEIVNNVAARLSRWKMQTLSIGGRLTHIKSVLGSLPIYHMSLFKVPLKVLLNMESIRGRFFNGNVHNGTKQVWVKWNNVLASKEKEGLGVLSLYALNRALLFKWIWRFHTHQSCLWTKVIKGIHGEDGNLDKQFRNHHPSLWLDIVKEVHQLQNRGIDLLSFMHMKMGNGEDTCFWEDKWRGDNSFKSIYPRVYTLETHKFVTVAKKISQFDLMCSFHRALRNDGETRWIRAVPIKVNILAWKVKLDDLPTRLNISKRGMDIESILCPLCDKNVESTSHIFFICPISREIFRKVSLWWEIDDKEVLGYEEWLEWLMNVHLHSNHKKLLEGVCYVMWWFIWNFRNKSIFGSSRTSKAFIFDEVLARSFLCMMGEIDISTLTLEQYFRLIEENQPLTMVNDEFGGIIGKDIEDLTIAEYIEYKAEMKRQSRRDDQSYFLTKYDDGDVGSFHREKNRTLDYPDYADDAKIVADYDLPPLRPCFKPIQPYIRHRNESSNGGLEEEISYILDGESVISEHKMSYNANAPKAPNLEPQDKGMSSDDDDIDMLVEMADMTQQTPLGTMKNGLVKIDKFVFPCDFVVIDIPGILGEMMILGRPFLATIHAQINVFNSEISLGIGENRVKFDVNGNSHHSYVAIERVYMKTYSQEK